MLTSSSLKINSPKAEGCFHNNRKPFTYNEGSFTTQVIGATKGVDHITISAEGICLEASCEWDISTLAIARRQSHSPMWECMQMYNPGRALE